MMLKRARILVLDDEQEILRTLRTNLDARGYDVATSERGEEALRLMAEEPPDVLVLDLAMPDLDGLEVIRRVRQHSSVPIIVVSVRGAERDKVSALDLGADDYVTKPFGIEELLARIRAALRRSARVAPSSLFASGDLRVDLDRRLVTVRGQEVHLTPTEYDLLQVFIAHAGRVLTHRTLLREVWHNQYGADSHYLHVYIAQLRRKIEPDPNYPRYIVTEPGVGYRFRVD